MAEKKRDSLAEHPLSPEAIKKKAKSLTTLDLFPDVGQAPIGNQEKTGKNSPAPRPKAPEAPPSSPEPKLAESTGTSERDAEAGPQTGVSVISTVSSLAAWDAVAFARRVAAGLADVLILALVGAIELAAGALVLDLQFPQAALLGLGAFLFLAAMVLLVLAPFVWGTTPGMALADLRVRAADGGSPTLSASFLRFLGFALTGALAGVPLLIAAFDRRGRTLADLLSGTTLAPAEHPRPVGRISSFS